MPRKEAINPDSLARPNPNLSLATRFGNLVFVSGQTGRDPTTGQIGKDIHEQTRFVMERIKVILAEAGTSLDNVLSATCYLTSMDDFAAFNEEYGKYFPANKPARATVQSGLMAPDVVVEVMVTACIPE